MDVKTHFSYGHNLTELCGSSAFVIWDESNYNFGVCFQKLLLTTCFALLAVISSYYIGKPTLLLARTRRQKIIIWFRIFVTLCSLFLSILQPCLLVLYAHLKLYWVDILLSSVQVFGWGIHLAYLNSLKIRITRGTRGPKPIIFAWVLTLIFQSFYAKTIWNAVTDPVEDESKDIFIIKLYQGVVTTQLIFQVLYLLSIFPHGRDGDTHYLVGSHGADISEYTDVSYRSYSRFQDTLDPFYLGLAEDGVNVLSYLSFYWVNLLMAKGSQGRLESVDDLYDLPHPMKSELVFQKIQKVMMINQPLTTDAKEVSYSKYSLLRALNKCFGFQFYSIGILKLISDSLAFAGPLLLRELILYVEGNEIEHWRGYAAGIGLCLASLISCLCTIHFNYLMAKINVQLRAALITSVFRKIHHVSSPSLSQFSSGEIVNMMSTDTDRVVNFGRSFHSFWSLPLQFSVTLYLLYRQIGIAFIAGVGIAVILLPINKILASKICKYSKAMMHFKDKRIHLMTEVLKMIKTVKLNSWETLFKRRIMDERFGEMKALAGRKYLDAACVYFWAATPVLIPIMTFGTYAALGNKMDPASVFTAVALFNMLIVPLNAFPWVINGLIEAYVSIKRIEKLMCMKEHNLNEYYTVVADMNNKTSELHIVLIGANFSWAPLLSFEEKKQEIEDDPQSIPSLPSTSCLSEGGGLRATGTPVSEVQTIISNRKRHPASSTGSTSSVIDSELYGSPELRAKFCLRNLNIKLKKGQLIGIVGSVGSGKTALLNAIMGELEKVYGIVAVAGLHQGFGLATQEPWLQNMSIKENIIFGQNFDPSRYRSVIQSCALVEDLETLSLRDETMCGENGASLSGGQRARVALARAVYQNKNIYLLDDVLSGVDVPIVHHIMQQCIHSFLVGKTVILVTNHLHVLGQADWIVQMDNGSILCQGHPKDLSQLGINTKNSSYGQFNENSSCPQPSSGAIPRQSSRLPLQEGTKICFQDSSTNYTEEVETRAVGELSSNVFYTYFTAIGALLSIMIFFSLILMQTSKNLSDTWLAKWVSQDLPPTNVSEVLTNKDYLQLFTLPDYLVKSWFAQDSLSLPNGSKLLNYDRNVKEMDPRTKFYLTVYSVLAVSNSIFTLFRAFLFAYGGLCAARFLHKRLLDAILNTKICFFDVNPLGRILNRFSTDIYSVDDTLPFQANIFFAQLFGLSGCLIVTIYAMPWILLLYIPLMFVYYNAQDYYRHTSRDLRRIYALSLSPLYSHFTETLNGISVIRAMRGGHRFSVNADAYLEQNQRAQFCIEVASQWLNFRLQLIGIGILVGVVLLSLWQHHITGIDPGLVGLVISYALTINGFLNGVVTSLTDTERELISVERLHQYLVGASREGENESQSACPPVALPLEWPNSGHIKFENVFLKYHNHNPYTLRDINLEIKATEKIGIVGRTGAGKSSLLVALFRIVELTRGRISIDNVDIFDINIKKLRTNLAIISQDALIFSGTIRENLDPREENFDMDILQAIERCQLLELVNQLGGLDGVLESSGENLSAGQKQLFCLTRALLCRTKIVCIDEGTSLLDYETDLKIQSVMRDAFRNKTVLIIAHRIHTIKDCDRVVVMSDGEIVEMGRPNELIENTSSAFHSMFLKHQ